MGFPFPVNCINCNNKQLECKASSQSKGSCHHCLLNGVECFFPVAAAVAASATVSAGVGVFPIQCNCFHCTQSHQQCHSSNRCQSQCSRCTKHGLPILYKLSSQGRRYDLEAGKSPAEASATNAVADTAADAAAFPAVASVLPTVAVMGDAWKIPVVATAVLSAADPLADTTAIFTVALAIPAVVVGGDAGNISVMALVVTSAVEGGAMPVVVSSIPMAAVGGEAGNISAMASAMASAVDAGAIPTVASAIPTAAVGGYAEDSHGGVGNVRGGGRGGDSRGGGCE